MLKDKKKFEWLHRLGRTPIGYIVVGLLLLIAIIFGIMYVINSNKTRVYDYHIIVEEMCTSEVTSNCKVVSMTIDKVK